MSKARKCDRCKKEVDDSVREERLYGELSQWVEYFDGFDSYDFCSDNCLIQFLMSKIEKNTSESKKEA